MAERVWMIAQDPNSCPRWLTSRGDVTECVEKAMHFDERYDAEMALVKFLADEFGDTEVGAVKRMCLGDFGILDYDWEIITQ